MHMFKCGSALTQVPDKEKTMNESLESPARRLLIKGMAGLGATLASSSLSPAIAGQTQSHQPGTLGHQVSPVQGGWGAFYSIERCRSIFPTCLPAVRNQRGAANWGHIHSLD